MFATRQSDLWLFTIIGLSAAEKNDPDGLTLRFEHLYPHTIGIGDAKDDEEYLHSCLLLRRGLNE